MNLKHLWVLAVVLVLLITEIGADEERILSRQRRFLSFPEGSSFAASICMTIGVIGNPVLEYLSWAVNWGVAYDLPNQTWIRQHKHGFSNSLEAETRIRNRYRRDLYDEIAVALDSMGFNGRDCLARTLCESAQYFGSHTGTMVEEIVKTIFSFPRHRRNAHEDPNAHHYDKAYSRGRVKRDCVREYPSCHFSLLELALGKYSVDPTKHGTQEPLDFM